MLCLLLLGIGIHQKTKPAIAPPIYDAMAYYAKGAMVWTEWGMGRLVNPFNVGATVRPPGTMLLSSPLGFAYDERFLRDLYGKHGLIIETIVHGDGSKRTRSPLARRSLV